MYLLFKGGNEYVELELDRATKTLFLSSSLTNYTKKQMSWKYLFDKGKETIQERLTDKMDDNQFLLALKTQMQNSGYTLVKGGDNANR